MSRTEFGERLYRARTRAKLTQPQLAKAAGMSQSALAEAERTGQGSKYTAQLAAACGVRSEWLAAGIEPMIAPIPAPRAIASDTIFDALTPDEQEFLENYRTLPDPDREHYAQEIGAKAEQMRAYLAKHLAKVGLPAPKSAAQRARLGRTKTTAEPTGQKPLFKGKEQPHEKG